MKIHGIVYLFVGILVIGFSYYITEVKQIADMQKFTLFMWVGGVFVLIGIVKIIAGILSRPRIAKENFHHHRNKIDNKSNHVQHGSIQGTQNSQNSMVKFCSGCGSAVRHFDNFCYKCGSRMFHKK